jgi:hypothetical protein
MLRGQRRTEAAGGGFQGSHTSIGQRPWPDRIIPQNLLQSKDLRSGNKQTLLPVHFRFLAKAPGIVDHRHGLNIEFKAEWRLAVFSPTPDGCFGNGADDLRRLVDVVKLLAVDDVRLRWSSRGCFGCWPHPATKRNPPTKINRNLGGIAYGGAAE